MKILGIETSCDETGLCIIETRTSEQGETLTILGNQLYSQVAKHAEFGGVFPMLAKREHAKNLVPLLEKCLEQANLIKKNEEKISDEQTKNILEILSRENDLGEQLLKLAEKIERPDFDAIAVTNGPGLEPALWVGVMFAKALNALWNIPIYPTNHMEGHVVVATLSPSLDKEGVRGRLKNQKSLNYLIQKVKYPAIALLISGGHTQLVLVKSEANYEIVGNTRDDAVGEAFDKVARMMNLPYPGGAEIYKQANLVSSSQFKFPRPMIHSKDLDFSFSGLKTAVLYTLKEIPDLTENIKQEISFEFQEAVVEVLTTKTKKALTEYGAQTLIVGGGVIANPAIRNALTILAKDLKIDFMLPEISASTDNALMIAVAGYLNIKSGQKNTTEFRASGNLSL